MINYCWKNADSSVVGTEHGLNVQKEFENYREKKCPVHTKSELKEVSKKKFYYCSRCRIDSLESKSSSSIKW